MKAQAQGAIMEHNIYLQIWKLDVIYKSNHFARYEIWILYESKQSICKTFSGTLLNIFDAHARPRSFTGPHFPVFQKKFQIWTLFNFQRVQV